MANITTPLSSTKKKVAVVGGGVSGIVAARVFKNQGFNVTVFEAGPILSGVWAKGYPGCSIQTPGSLYEFPDKPAPPPKDYRDAPSIQKYVEDYAEEHGLNNCIQLNTRVDSITAADDEKWTITTKATNSNSSAITSSEVFDFVALATGVYSPCCKKIPKIEGIENFQGGIYHTVDTEGLAKGRKGKKVLIVGFGKSAHDCAMNAYEETGSAPTILFRSAHWCVPRKVLGLIPMEWLLYSRFGQGTLPAWQTCGPMEFIFHTVFFPLIWLYWRIVETIITLQFGLWGSSSHLRPKLAIEDDMYCGHGIIAHPDFFPSVNSGKINTVKGSIQCVLPSGAVKLNDGSEIEADEIVFATGYKRDHSFLPKEIAERKEEDGFFTYRQMLVPGVPNIAFLNSNVTTFSNITTPGLQAAWLAELIQGNIRLPDDMEKTVEKEKAWRREKLKYAGECRAFFIQLHQIRYWDSLLIDIGANVKRKRDVPILRAFKTLFEPIYSQDYMTIVSGEWKKNPSETASRGYSPTFLTEWFVLAACMVICRFIFQKSCLESSYFL